MEPLSELGLFSLVVQQGSLTAAARELSLTPAAVSKRIASLERRLGVRLLNRTTRSISLTAEGEIYQASGSKILAELHELEQVVGKTRVEPKGQLRINASFGFGRVHVAPAVSDFIKENPAVTVQLDLTDRAWSFTEQNFDVGVRFGQIPDSRIYARKIASNRRLICAAPSYLRRNPEPTSPRDLARHNCVVLRENKITYGTWHFIQGKRNEAIKVRGGVTSNDGDATVAWALEGHGVIMRSEWDVARYLRTGRLKVLLEDWSLPPADVYIVYQERQLLAAKIRAFVDFMADRFADQLEPRDLRDSRW